MKCDELKAYRNLDVAFNTAMQMETVIAEDYEGYGIEFEEDDEVYLKDEVDSAIAELKQKLHDGEMQSDLAECAVTEYKIDCDKLNAENRRLKRALWLARAYRAEARKNYWYARSIHEGDKYLWSIDGTAVKYIGCIKRTNFDWLLTWGKVEDKCRAKAEEYK